MQGWCTSEKAGRSPDQWVSSCRSRWPVGAPVDLQMRPLASATQLKSPAMMDSASCAGRVLRATAARRRARYWRSGITSASCWGPTGASEGAAKSVAVPVWK
eukprot:4471983-Pyramimonas_sp.AAC.1